MFKKAIFMYILAISVLYAETPVVKPKRFLKGQVKIDGVITEEEWGDFKPIEDFYEFQPEEGKKPPVKTQVFVGYDDKNLYVAFKCYDDMKTVRKVLTPRDQLSWNNDVVFVYVWTYAKGSEGYSFGTNPLSVQYDGKKEPPPNNYDNWKFDTYWNVKSFISDSFWSAEFQIPFSSLRFKVKDIQKWRIAFLRIRPRKSVEMYAFPKQSNDIPSFYDQTAILVIPERITFKSKRLTLIPYLTGSQSGEREQRYNNKGAKFDIGITNKYQFSSNLVLDFALNPDYSNIETDIPQIDVNTNYALYYPEKRPFFMEGSGIIETPIDVFYTRMVNNPLYALKLTGKVSNIDLYLLSAYDENSIYIVPLEDQSVKFPTSKKSFINFARIRKSILNRESYVGLTFGDREMRKDTYDNGFGRIAGFDTKIMFLKHYTFSFQGIYSKTKEPEDTTIFEGNGMKFDKYTDKFDGEEFDGFGYKASFNSYFKHLSLSLSHKALSPTFRSDLGYISSNNYKNYSIDISPIIYPHKFSLNKVYLGAGYYKESNFEHKFKGERISLYQYIEFAYANTFFNFQQSFYNMAYQDSFFKGLNHYYFSVNSTPSRMLSMAIGFSTDKELYYDELIPAYGIHPFGLLNLNLNKLSIELQGNRELLYRRRYKDLIYDVSVISLRANYSFTNAMSFRLTSFYYTYNKSVGFSPLFTYQLSPFTVFYLGANVNTSKREILQLKAQNHEIFMKLQYVFKI